MSSDGGDGGHVEGDEIGDDGPEFGVHENHTGESLFGGGKGPVEIVAVGEELAVSGGDEDRRRRRLGSDSA